MTVVAKARVLEITLSVMGAADDGYPTPMPTPDADSASDDRLVVSVRIRGAKRYWIRRPWIRPA